ncbi:hypothetical protein HAX54_042119 [Datura stramonium]|uniref:Uncharacterized protein n=1 Tax=Datura stramonium TaxID=4076 RepID=A0ABS8SLM8_DATST|nr:hypothetical protein [Datura stramonium]
MRQKRVSSHADGGTWRAVHSCHRCIYVNFHQADTGTVTVKNVEMMFIEQMFGSEDLREGCKRNQEKAEEDMHANGCDVPTLPFCLKLSSRVDEDPMGHSRRPQVVFDFDLEGLSMRSGQKRSAESRKKTMLYPVRHSS